MRSRLIINGSELGLGWGTKVSDLRIGLDMLGSCLLDMGLRRSRSTAVREKVEPGRRKSGRKSEVSIAGVKFKRNFAGAAASSLPSTSRNPCNRDNGV